jgi:hypothetical protein
VTDRLRVAWPDPQPFADREGEPIRILAISDEPDPALDSPGTREVIGRVDLIVGAGDLQPDYLSFVSDAFQAPLRYVRGNHDTGLGWSHTRRKLLPEPMPDGQIVEELGIRILPFSGSPRYNQRGMQVSSIGMWWQVVTAWFRATRARPLLLVTHAPPRGLNDDRDLAHRGFAAFRWLIDRIQPPLWLHGHTALVRRGLDDRCERHGPTLLYNCTGATLVELMPPDADSRATADG